jgi:membrane protease YdiL (CAAX protease family)
MGMRSRKDLRDMAPIEQPDTSSGTTSVTPVPAPAKGENAAPSVGRGSFQLRAGPILVVIVLSIALWVASHLILDIVGGYVPVAALHNQPLVSLYIDHAIEFGLALLVIQYLRRTIPGDFGLRLPPGRSYVGTAVLAGVFLGILMGLLNSAPQLLSHMVPDVGYRMTAPNVVGSLFFQGIYAGPTEEVPYRALLVTYLTAKMPGTIRWRKLEMNGANVVVAVILAFGFADSFFKGQILAAIGQLIGGFVLGVSYAYWFEKSRSVLAPAVGHNVTNLTTLAMVYAIPVLLK